MAVDWKTVTILGRPGTDVTIYPRTQGEDPVPSVFEGGIDSNGRIKLLLPAEYFAVVNSQGSTKLLNLREGPDTVTLRLDDGEAS
jgi:hypothetical protein